jgi:hypothetical protein
MTANKGMHSFRPIEVRVSDRLAVVGRVTAAMQYRERGCMPLYPDPEVQNL